MNHYKYLERVLPTFFEVCEVTGGWECNGGIIGAHGDKGYGYRDRWEQAGLKFPKAMAVYMLTYVAPYGHEVRETDNGWVDVADWVIDNYNRFADVLPETTDEED